MTAKKTAANAEGKLDPSNAAKIRQANLANLVRKLKAGKTLTSAELRILEESEDHERELVTLQRVLDVFGISRKTISIWRKEGKDVPEKVGTKEDMGAWRAWFAAHPDAGFAKGKPRRDRETLLCEKLEIEIQKHQIQLDQLSGELLPLAAVNERDYRIGAAVKSALQKLCNDSPPMLEGLPANKIQKVLKEQTDGIIEMLSDEQSDFWKESSRHE